MKRNVLKARDVGVAKTELLLSGWVLHTKTVGTKKPSYRYMWMKKKGGGWWTATTWHHSFGRCCIRAQQIERGEFKGQEIAPLELI